MNRSKVKGAVFMLAMLGGVLLAASGCSNDDSHACSPDVGLPGSGFDGYPPATPTGVDVAKATDAGFKLQWSPNAEADLDGYRVYVYDPSPFRTTSYVCCHGNGLVSGDRDYYMYCDDLYVGTHYFRLTAVDVDGNESVPTAPVEFYYNGGATEESRLEGEEGEPAPAPRASGSGGSSHPDDYDWPGGGSD
ncbi:MAG: hypothetical protein GF330_06845 [Candidatus Eisenbacteria bacterium]|nr:hypothetical protein [Candidatus Eisenbacteria bacterium]